MKKTKQVFAKVLRFLKRHLKAVIAVAIIALLIFNFDIIFAVVYQSEKVGPYEVSEMIGCKIPTESTTTVDINGKKCSLLLPKGAIKFKFDDSFLITTSACDNYADYLKSKGYKMEREDNGDFLVTDKNGNGFLVFFTMYTKFFEKIYVERGEKLP